MSAIKCALRSSCRLVAVGIVAVASACGSEGSSTPTQVSPSETLRDRSDTTPAVVDYSTALLPSTTEATPDSLMVGSSAVGVESSIDDIVFPASDGTASPDTMVECWGTRLPLSALLEMPLLADLNLPDIEAALESAGALVDFAEAASVPWMVLTRTPTRIELIAFENELQSSLALENREGEWRFAGGGRGGPPCTALTVLPEGLGEVNWIVDPAFGAPAASDSVLHLLATERECASGRPMDDRLIGPRVEETETAVRITFAVTPLPGDQNCPSNPATPITIALKAPLGQRAMIEGRSLGVITDLLA